MLCKFCSNIDLDQLSVPQGYLHHTSCTDLVQSAQNGCESCELICNSQWTEIGGELSSADSGELETQIIARAVNQRPGSFKKVRYGQERRRRHHQSTLMTGYNPDNGSLSPDPSYLWSFLTIAATPDAPSSELLKLRPLAHRPPDGWLHLASKWLKDCLTNHEACSKQSLPKFPPPSRVIDVGPSDSSVDPFLHISEDEVQEWVTLSYCWDTKPSLETTLLSLSAHLEAIPTKQLPPLFRDAVKITRALGYRYLWINSLCIVQDSKEDLMQETPNIGNIYKHSVFTISADNCRDSNFSILGNHLPVDINYIPQGCCSTQYCLEGTMHAYSPDLWQEKASEYGFLRSQAWALQEEVFSPRTLKWTPLQLAWSCRTSEFSEEEPTDTEHHIRAESSYYPTKMICLSASQLDIFKKEQKLLHPHSNDYDPMTIWYRLVRDFCLRKIKFEEDTFPAISNLAKEVKKHTGYGYNAGIWVQNIHNGLLWSVVNRAEYPSTYIAPSWSWASIKGGSSVRPACWPPLDHVYAGAQDGKGTNDLFLSPIADILENHVDHSGDDEFGQLKSGRLRLKGPFKSAQSLEHNEIRLPLAEDKLRTYGTDPSTYKIHEKTISCWLDERSMEEADEREFVAVNCQLSDRGVIFIQIASIDSSRFDVERSAQTNNYYLEAFYRSMRDQTWALVLEPVREIEGNWRRIGVARIADGLVDGWTTGDFTVV